MKKYKVINIYEQDFGCEGLPEGKELSVDVVLCDIEGKEEVTISVPDAELYEKNIDVGSIVSYDNKEIRLI